MVDNKNNNNSINYSNHNNELINNPFASKDKENIQKKHKNTRIEYIGNIKMKQCVEISRMFF